MTRIYLIRHAENDFIRKGKLPGWLPGIHLNARGRAQAKALAEILAEVKLGAIHASPLERAMETAEPIAQALGLDVITCPSLGEIHIGEWEGRSLRTLRWRKSWSMIQQTPSLVRFPEGESFMEAQDRAVTAIEALRQGHSRSKFPIACVTHADVIKLILAHYLGVPMDLFQRLTVMPASISILEIDAQIRLISLNDTRATLAGLRE
jgi:probable phosphomutase (TIGR03848 family)